VINPGSRSRSLAAERPPLGEKAIPQLDVIDLSKVFIHRDNISNFGVFSDGSYDRIVGLQIEGRSQAQGTLEDAKITSQLNPIEPAKKREQSRVGFRKSVQSVCDKVRTSLRRYQ
jgi:hypothetical protein